MAFRTQKISQMTPKGSDLEATDLIEVSTIESGSYVTRSITGQELIDAIPAPSVDWGDIGGTLSDQTDLNTALSGKVPTSRTLTINGTTQDLSADRTFTISTGITIGTTAITSGTVGRVLFEGTGNVVQESANLTWDNTNGIFNVVGRINAKSTTAQPSSLIVEGTTGVNSGNAGFVVRTGTGYQATFFAADSLAGQGIAGLGIFSGSATPFGLQTGAPNGAFFIHNNGNIGIGTSYTNAGFRLDVNGTARVSDNVLLTNGIIATSGATTRLQGSLNYFTHNRIASSGAFGFQIATSGTVTSFWRWDSATYDMEIGSPSGALSQNFKLFTAGSERMRLTAGGNVLINTTTDAGFRLDVNGTARFTGAVTTPAFATSSGYLGIVSTGSGGIYGLTLNQPIYLWNRQLSTGNGIVIDDFNGVAGGNLNLNLFNIGGGYSTSGTCVHNTLMISRAINMASGNQTVRGIYYNPTLTNTTGLTTHYAIHTAVGRIRFENLPTSATGLATGDIWNDAGTLKIV